MTIRQPPKVCANTAAMAKSAKDIRSSMAQCPLMNQKLQLLPLRYGLVEQLDPAAELSMPFKLKSQPLGIRLLRDGYLYIIDDNTGYLHEYRIEQGQVSKLLWNSQEVSGDTRTTSVGEPYLVFTRQHTLYAGYSEIQWTAYKCSQVLKDKTERERLMQRIDPASACPINGAAHLLSQTQAQSWLAEVAENTPKTDVMGVPLEAPIVALPEGANPQERQPYCWEDSPLFHDTAIEALTSKVLGLYQDDYLFLVLRDDFGVMRDLASLQLKVADWIGQWSDDEACQRQYLTGAYIQSLYEVSPASLDAMSGTDPHIKALKEGTTAEQQTALFDYLRAKRDYRGPEILGDEAHWRKAAHTSPYAQAAVNLQDALGTALWQQHRGTIGALHVHTWEALHGTEIGRRGIDHLTRRAEMEAFVGQQQTLLSHWHKRLEQVREDRLAMITGGYFHRAAWYYDFRLDTHIQHRLETEFVCVAALCWNRAAAEKLAAYLQANPLTAVPGLDTLPLAEQSEIARQLLDLGSFSINMASAHENFASANALVHQFNSLMSQRLPNYANLNTRFRGLQSLLDQAYSPAHQLKIADKLDLAVRDFHQRSHIDPNSFIRDLGAPARLQLLREFSRSGLTLRAASAAEIIAFNQNRDVALDLRSELKNTYALRNRELILQTSGFSPPGSEQRYNAHINQLQATLAPLEENLSRALTVGGGGPSQIGTVVDGLDPQLRYEMNRTVRDFRATGTFEKPFGSALKSKADGIALLLFVYQGQKFIEALNTARNKDNYFLSDKLALAGSFIGMSAAGFAMVQGLSVTIFQAHLQEMSSAAGKLNTMSRLGRWTGLAGFGAFVFGVPTAATDLGRHSWQWGKALAEGNAKGLAATSLQIVGDGVLLGTNTWGAKHTGSIILNIMKTPKELRALAWAEASPRLVSIGARANLVGLIATALQLTGEGLYNYFNLDALQKWIQASAWGTADLQRSLEDDWSALARVVQAPTCELIREAKDTYLKLVLPGIRTREMDSRHLQLLAFQKLRDKSIERPYSPVPRPLFWRDSSAAWAARASVASQDEEALTLHLPISEHLQTSEFALALNIGYQLEAERDLIHRTCFVLRDLHITTIRGVRLPQPGTFKLEPVEALPAETGEAPFWLFTRDEMAPLDAKKSV